MLLREDIGELEYEIHINIWSSCDTGYGLVA